MILNNRYYKQINGSVLKLEQYIMSSIENISDFPPLSEVQFGIENSFERWRLIFVCGFVHIGGPKITSDYSKINLTKF